MTLTPDNMTFADLLYAAGFWQWVGIISITSIIVLGAVVMVALICGIWTK